MAYENVDVIDMKNELPKELVSGWSAYWHDAPQSSCPFEEYSENRSLWMIGWNGAKDLYEKVTKPYLDKIMKYADKPFVQSWLKLRELR